MKQLGLEHTNLIQLEILRQETITTFVTIGLKVATGYYYKYTCESSQRGEIHKN